MSTSFSSTSLIWQNKFSNKTSENSETKKETFNSVKNDNIKNEFVEALREEMSKSNVTDTKEMDLQHITNEFKNWFSKDQAQSNQYQLLCNVADALTVSLNSVFQQLATSNAQVADLDSQKTNAEAQISAKAKEISTLKAEKDGQLLTISTNKRNAMNAHDNRIGELESAQSSLANSISTSKATLSDKKAQLQAAKNSGSNNEEANATDNSATIASLEAEIASLEAKIKQDEAEKEKINNSIASEKSARTATETKYNEAYQNTLDSSNKKIAQASNEQTQLEEKHSIINADLAQAVLVQTGLTMEQANLECIQKENLAAKNYAEVNLQNIRANEEMVEAKQAKQEEELKVAKKEAEEAKATTNEKQTLYEQQETEKKGFNLMF